MKRRECSVSAPRRFTTSCASTSRSAGRGMTTTARSPERTERRKAAATGTETRGPSGDHERRQAAIAALLHRVSGGLNNAAMAFELGIAPAAGEEPSQRV